MKNPIEQLYLKFWVPVFGRILMLFSKWIEGEPVKEIPTYDLENINRIDKK